MSEYCACEMVASLHVVDTRQMLHSYVIKVTIFLWVPVFDISMDWLKDAIFLLSEILIHTIPSIRIC